MQTRPQSPGTPSTAAHTLASPVGGTGGIAWPAASGVAVTADGDYVALDFRRCARCDAPLTDRQTRFCSVACAGRMKKSPDTKVCAECGETFPTNPNNPNRAKFCSRSCAATHSNRGKSRAVDPMKRIAARIEKLDNGCWHFQGAHRGGDQRRPHIGSRGKSLYVHRVLWEDANGPIPAGHEIHHVCFDHRCVNPEHFELLTISEHRRLHADLQRSTT